MTEILSVTSRCGDTVLGYGGENTCVWEAHTEWVWSDELPKWRVWHEKVWWKDPWRENCTYWGDTRQKMFEGTCFFEKRALLLQSELFVFLGMKECRTWRGGLPERPFGIAVKWPCLCSEGSQAACVHICFKLSWCCFLYFFFNWV